MGKDSKEANNIAAALEELVAALVDEVGAWEIRDIYIPRAQWCLKEWNQRDKKKTEKTELKNKEKP